MQLHESRTATSLAFHVFPPSKVSSSVCRLPNKKPGGTAAFFTLALKTQRSTWLLTMPGPCSGCDASRTRKERASGHTVPWISSGEAYVQKHYTRVNRQVHLTAQPSAVNTSMRGSLLEMLRTNG